MLRFWNAWLKRCLAPTATVLLTLTFSGSLGCGDNSVESPSPAPGSLEPYEDQEWGGWLDYSDATVQLHLYTTFELFSYRDGMFCGRYRGWWFSYGSYLAVNNGLDWIMVFQDTPDDGQEGGTEGRMYGTVDEGFRMWGWLDLTTTDELAAVDSSAVPAFPVDGQYFYGIFNEASILQFDTLPISIGELINYVSREMYEPMSADTAATLPLADIIDLPMYPLTPLGPIDTVNAESVYCQWCKEPGDDETPNPSLADSDSGVLTGVRP